MPRSRQFRARSWDDVAIAINDLDPSLAGVLVYSEPGSFEKDGVLYLSLKGLGNTGRVFLMATPQSAAVLHDGTMIFEFESLEEGTLIRVDGVPRVHLRLPPQPGFPLERRGGQADFHAGNTVGGLLQPALHAEELPEMFQFSSTGTRLVQAKDVPALGIAGGGLLASLLTWVGCSARRLVRSGRAGTRP